jgi:hypothetical protein
MARANVPGKSSLEFLGFGACREPAGTQSICNFIYFSWRDVGHIERQRSRANRRMLYPICHDLWRHCLPPD